MKRSDKHAGNQEDVNFRGMFRALGGLMDLLSNLSEQGAEIKRSGAIEGLNDEKKGVKAVYGLSVRFGGHEPLRVEPFGNVQVNQQGPVVEQAREPLVDVFDESDHILVVAEMPGVDTNDVRFEIRGDILELSAGSGDRRYHKEVLLPQTPGGEPSTSYRNGIFELKIPKGRP